MRQGKRRITRAEYDRLGGMRNPRLYRAERSGRWAYFATEGAESWAAMLDARRADCDGQKAQEWSGSPCPVDPDNYWIDDATGERVAAREEESGPCVIWNLEQLDISRAQARDLAARGLIYDPHEGDPESETAPGWIYYPTDDESARPLDAIKAALESRVPLKGGDA